MNTSKKTPETEKQKKTVDFFSGWAGSYEKGLSERWFRSVHAEVIRVIDPKPTDSILDVGCGTGRALRGFSTIVDSGRLAGVDLSEKMIEEAAHKASGIDNLEYHVASADELPFDDETFDHVTSMNSFHHYPDQRKALGEMIRVLKSDGSLYIADMTGHVLPFPIAGNKIWNMIERPFAPQVNALSRRDFRDLFQEVGLAHVRQLPASQAFRRAGRYWLAASALQLIAGFYYPVLIATGIVTGLMGVAISAPSFTKTITTGKKCSRDA